MLSGAERQKVHRLLDRRFCAIPGRMRGATFAFDHRLMCLTAIIGIRLWKLVFLPDGKRCRSEGNDVCLVWLSLAAGSGTPVARGPGWARFEEK